MKLSITSLFLAMLAASALRAGPEAVGLEEDMARLRAEIVELEKQVLPPVLMDRANIEAVYGTDSAELRWGRNGLEEMTRCRLRADPTLDIYYVDDYAARVHVPVPGAMHGMTATVRGHTLSRASRSKV